LNGDQALFLSYARRFDEGWQLYVDLWDVKPPAVFAFYYLGGSLFGFTDRGIHLFELLWMVVLAAAMIISLRPHLRQPWLAAVAPIAALGSYYGSCSFQEQTQIESLVNLPTFLSVIALTAAGRPAAARPKYAALAGMAAAVATAFKVVFAPIFIGLLLATTVAVVRGEGSGASRQALLRLCLPYAVGAAAVWASCLIIFFALGTADAMLWTVFVYPFEALASVGYAPMKRLVAMFGTFVGDFAPWLIFLALALPLLWRHGAPLIAKLLWIWLALGVVVILAQRTSWWYYHFMLLLAPIGGLAAFGVDRAVSFLRRRAHLAPATVMGIACLLVLPAVGSIADPLASTANLLFPSLIVGNKPIESFKSTVENYAEISKAAAFVSDQPRPGPVMVFETPLIDLLSGREQALPVHGFIWQWVLRRQHEQSTEMFKAVLPPFVFVGSRYEELVSQRTPGIMALLASGYRVVWQSPLGRWYALADPPSSPGIHSPWGGPTASP
jgi:hypothetical protein